MKRAKVCAQLLLFVAIAVVLTRLVPVNDFVGYWSAGHQLLHRSDPYSPVQMLATEKAVGWPGWPPLLVWNPPWVLPILIPLGGLPYHIAHFVWALASLMAVVVSWEALCEGMNVAKGNRVIWLVSFVPVIICLLIGQAAAFLLLGLVSFLRCIRRGDDAGAGLSAALLAIKPQLVYLFWPALLVWAVGRRKWLLLVVLFGALATLSAVALLLDAKIFSTYLQQFRDGPMFPSHATGTVLRALFGRRQYWLQLLPSAAGLLWFAIRSWGRKTFDWTAELPLLAVVSLPTSSYAWVYDQVLLLPALAQAVSWSQAVAKRQQFLLLAAYLLICVISSVLAFTSVRAGAIWWVIPWGYLLLYIIARPTPAT